MFTLKQFSYPINCALVRIDDLCNRPCWTSVHKLTKNNILARPEVTLVTFFITFYAREKKKQTQNPANLMNARYLPH